MWGWLALLGGGGILLIVGLERWRRRREFYAGPHYMQQIQILTPSKEEALELPKVRPLRGVKQTPWHRLRRVR